MPTRCLVGRSATELLLESVYPALLERQHLPKLNKLICEGSRVDWKRSHRLRFFICGQAPSAAACPD